MEVVEIWTGKLAGLLRTSLRLTHEEFAQQLGTSVRNVAKWNSDPDVVPTPELQRALDTTLDRADDASRRRFLRLRWGEVAAASMDQANTEGAELRLANDPVVSQVLTWIDNHAHWPAGQARRRVAEQLRHLTPAAVVDKAQARSRVDRQDVAAGLSRFYAEWPAGYIPCQALYDGERILTSILTRNEWLDLRLPRAEQERAALDSRAPNLHVSFDDVAVNAATLQVATAAATGSKIVNSTIYRLLKAEISPSQLDIAFGTADFITYALTMDLLENELSDALARRASLTPENLPLRTRYLPSARSILDINGRLCGGGSLALFAAARPGRRGKRADYVVLVQERSERVLNAARRLAVIPKSFHQPLVDISDDTRISANLERELEEELFGREDVDSTRGGGTHADPLHPSRLSEPMRWLVENPGIDRWRMECTGFGFNLVSGNYEFASLIVIDDEEWWSRYGGHIEANWESDRLQRFSTLDAATIGGLVHDGSWSNEGLFAFLLGLRRLAEIGGDRVSLPTIKWEH